MHCKLVGASVFSTKLYLYYIRHWITTAGAKVSFNIRTVRSTCAADPPYRVVFLRRHEKSRLRVIEPMTKELAEVSVWPKSLDFIFR